MEVITACSYGKVYANQTLLDEKVIADARRIAGEADDSTWVPTDPRDIANKIFHTCYMGTENSSSDTRKRAKDLAEAIGRYVLRCLALAFD